MPVIVWSTQQRVLNMSLQLSQEELTMLLSDAKIVKFPLIDSSFHDGDVDYAFESIVSRYEMLKENTKATMLTSMKKGDEVALEQQLNHLFQLNNEMLSEIKETLYFANTSDD